MEIEFKDTDIWAYLSTKHDNDPIGTCALASHCLIAQAVRWKYPGTEDVRVTTDILAFDGVQLPTTDQMKDIIEVFDGTGPAHHLISKRRFMSNWTLGKRHP